MKKLVLFAQIVGMGLFATACGPQGGGDSDGSKKSDADKKESKTEKAEKVDRSVNVDESNIVWSGTSVGVYTHKGDLSFKKGTFTAKGNKIVKGKFVADLNSMRPTDDNFNPDEEGKTKDDLVEHLKSDDFFNVEEHPTAKFEVTAHDAEKKTLTGNLTIRGNTNEEVVKDFKFDAKSGKAKGKLTFDRHEYDVAFKHPLEDVVIADDVELEISIVSKKS